MGPWALGQLLVCRAVEPVAGVVMPGEACTVVDYDEEGVPLVEFHAGTLRVPPALQAYFVEAP